MNYDMNVVSVGQSVRRIFTINNLGTNYLNLGNLSVKGNQYSVIQPSTTTVFPGKSVTFTVTYSASLTKSETATLSIPIRWSPDFIVNLTGVGIATPSNLVYHNPLDGNATTLVGPAATLVGAASTMDRYDAANKALSFDGTSNTYINTNYNFDPGAVSTTRTPFSFLLWYKSIAPTTIPGGTVFDVLFSAGFITPPAPAANGCWAYFFTIDRTTSMLPRFFYYFQNDAGGIADIYIVPDDKFVFLSYIDFFMTMKVRINSLLKLVSGITNASALFLPFVVSIYCNTSNLNNPNDLGSRSFLQIKAIECILKSPNCPTGPTLGYSASSFLFPQNFSISTVSPTVSEIISSCSSSPALPLGLSLSSGCLITGTPTTLQSSTRYAISASGANGSMNANINITIFIGALVQLNFDNGSLSDSGTLGISLSSTTGTPIKVTGKDGDSNGAYSFGGADFFSTALNGDTGLPLGANSRT
ncbi:MAG: hypothetical protein K8R21_00125, partial [Leptospira sp.]|nr:hypothetical protein [Leptospira sp.]